MIRLAEIFQDGMVLQRGKNVRLWGTTDHRQVLEVFLNGKKVAQQEAEGDFDVFLPAQEAMENAEIRIVGEAA